MTANFYGIGKSWEHHLGECVQDAADFGIGFADKICSFLTFGIGGNKPANQATSESYRANSEPYYSQPPAAIDSTVGLAPISANIMELARASVTPSLVNLQAGECDMSNIGVQATPLCGIIAAAARLQTAQPSMMRA